MRSVRAQGARGRYKKGGRLVWEAGAHNVRATVTQLATNGAAVVYRRRAIAGGESFGRGGRVAPFSAARRVSADGPLLLTQH